MVITYIVYEIDLWPFNVVKDCALGNSLFGPIKLTMDDDLDKYKYSGNGTVIDAHIRFLLLHGSGFGKNVIIFAVDMSSFVHINNKKKDVSILGKGPKWFR